MVLLASTALAAALGGPAEEPIELHWDAPAPCPTQTHVRDTLGTLLSEAHPPAEHLVARATVQGAPGRYVLQLTLSTPTTHDQRSFAAPHCDQLANATALIVATLVDAVAVADRVVVPAAEPVVVAPEADEDVAVVRRESPPSPSQPPAPSPRSKTRTRPRVSLGARVEGLVGRAAIPRVDAGVAGALGLAVSRVRVEVGGSHTFAQPERHPTLAGVALRVRASTAVVRACGVPRRGAWEFPLCIAGEFGLIAARGEGAAVANPQTVRSLYANAAVEAHVVFRPTPRWGIWVGGQGILNATRPRFTIGDLAPFYVVPPGGGRAKLGVEVRFW